VQCVSFITVLSTATVTGYTADARFPFDNATAIVEATEANACIIGLYCTRHSIINRMLSYLLNYKSIPPDKRPVLFNQHASDAPTRKLLDRHVGAADSLRNGGSRTKSQPNISFEEYPVIKNPSQDSVVASLSHRMWRYHHHQRRLLSFQDHDLKLVCFAYVTFLHSGDNSVKYKRVTRTRVKI